MVGGGIGGLAAAAFLRRAGLPATVYEQAPALGEVGAGLVVAPNAARLLRRLPSEFRLERAGVVLESGWEFRRWADGAVLAGGGCLPCLFGNQIQVDRAPADAASRGGSRVLGVVCLRGGWRRVGRRGLRYSGRAGRLPRGTR